jgi:two-component system sensor histidine kinase AtoS
MKTSFPFTSLLSRKNRIPGPTDFQAILDLIPEAALVIDRANSTILWVNSKATEITSYTRAELSGMRILELFAVDGECLSIHEYDSHSNLPGMGCEGILHRRGGSTMQVEITPSMLDAHSDWMLNKIESKQEKDSRRDENDRRDNQWQALNKLSHTPLKESLEEALLASLEAGQQMSGAPIIAVYCAQADRLSLKRQYFIGIEKALPDHISSQDFFMLQSPRLWQFGKRSHTQLHRSANASRLPFVASVPIGQPGAYIGLLIAAGEQPPASTDQLVIDPKILEIMEVVAGQITVILQSHIVLENINNELQEKDTSLAISNQVKEAMRDGKILLDLDLTIQDLNPSAEQSLGYTLDEVFHQPIDNILISTISLKNAYQDAINDKPATISNIHLYRRNGHSFLANLHLLPVKIDGKIHSLVLLINDLSEQEQYRLLNQQLEQRAYLGEVTASFAHEVRNPINNISTGLQLLEMNLPADDPNQENIKRLQQDCIRLTELIKSGLSFIKPLEYKFERLDLGSLVQEIMGRMHPRLARINIQHPIQIEENVPYIEGDPRAIEQIINNLVSNAVTAMSNLKTDTGGTLSIKIRSLIPPGERKQVELSVSDTGPGISDEIRDHIFEPFYTTHEAGTGLGLAIVKRIVTAHKGVIKVQSVPGGTVFQVRFPAAPSQEEEE